jgi:signal transduction histidine kinase
VSVDPQWGTGAGDLEGDYAGALRNHLIQGGESGLARAHELGREAIALGLGILDVNTVHHDALSRSLQRAELIVGRVITDQRAAEFLAEALSPFEMMHRGFREANAQLGEVNAALTRRASELAKTLADLDREQTILAGVMAGMKDGIVVVDAADRIRYLNERASELLGLENPRIGDPATPLWSRLGATLEELRMLGAEADRSFDVALRGQFPNELVGHVFPIDVGREGTGIGIVLEDVTAERKLARAREELVSIVIHELRSPLQSIVGFAHFLQSDATLSTTQQRHVGVIESEGFRLNQIVADFLDIRQIESGPKAIQPLPTDVRPLLEDTVAAASDSPIHSFVLDLPEDVPYVSADAPRIRQVLTNLLSNARRYSPAGGEIRIVAEVTAGEVQISIADRGLGIPAEALPELFEKFFRVTTPDRAEISGTGLGLTICKMIVDAHGGTIWAESDGPGRGARFCFTLPVAAES